MEKRQHGAVNVELCAAPWEKSTSEQGETQNKMGGGERWRLGKCSSDKAIKRTSGLMDF